MYHDPQLRLKPANHIAEIDNRSWDVIQDITRPARSLVPA
jgi:hypothetical protein